MIHSLGYAIFPFTFHGNTRGGCLSSLPGTKVFEKSLLLRRWLIGGGRLGWSVMLRPTAVPMYHTADFGVAMAAIISFDGMSLAPGGLIVLYVASLAFHFENTLL